MTGGPGSILDRILTPGAQFPTSLTFGGANKKRLNELFITTSNFWAEGGDYSGAVMNIKMNVRKDSDITGKSFSGTFLATVPSSTHVQ